LHSPTARIQPKRQTEENLGRLRLPGRTPNRHNMSAYMEGPLKISVSSMTEGVTTPRDDVPWKIDIEGGASAMPAPPPGLGLVARVVKSPPPGLEEVVLAALSPDMRKASSCSTDDDDDEMTSETVDNVSEDQSWEELYNGLTALPETYYSSTAADWWSAPGLWQAPVEPWMASLWSGEGSDVLPDFSSWWAGLDPSAVELEEDVDEDEEEDQLPNEGEDASKSKKKKKTRSRKSAAKKVKKLSLASESTTADGEDGDNTASKEETWTTVMMRNVPNDFTGTMLIDLLNKEGFYAKYNLVYLPMDYHRKAGFGYAFIDLVSTEDALHFRDHFQGFSNWGLVSHKVCEVGWSDALQGVQAHIDRYRNSPVMHGVVPDEFKPMLFSEGERIAFPTPTKSVRAPRLRKKDPRLMSQKMPRRLTATPAVPEAEAVTLAC